MVSYFKYFMYVIRHKYYVGKECFRVRLYWRGIKHDLSKFLPSEFFPYANHFYGKNKFNDMSTESVKLNHTNKRDSTGYYKPTNTGDMAFDKAWLLHKNRNSHHWQHWIIPDVEEIHFSTAIDPEYKDLVEMVCDWMGAAQAQGKPRSSVKMWWRDNAFKMIFSEDVFEKLSFLLEKMV